MAAAAFKHSRHSAGEGASALEVSSTTAEADEAAPDPTWSSDIAFWDAISVAPQAVFMPATAVSRPFIWCGIDRPESARIGNSLRFVVHDQRVFFGASGAGISEEDRVLTSRDVAHRLGVSIKTAQAWIETHVPQSWKTPVGHRRAHERDVLAAQMRMINARVSPMIEVDTLIKLDKEPPIAHPSRIDSRAPEPSGIDGSD